MSVRRRRPVGPGRPESGAALRAAVAAFLGVVPAALVLVVAVAGAVLGK